VKLSYRNEKNAKFIALQYSKSLDSPDWYKIDAVSDDEADILLYDYIGWPFNEAGEFIRALASLKQGKIIIRINSPGGDVWDASAIHNAIKAHPSKPITRIESLAASAASYVAVAGSEKQAYKNTMAMIHEPMTGIWGNQYELREVADILEQISGTMVDMYADNTNVGKRELKDMMKVETWMNAKKMKEKGFIDTILEPGKGAKAQFDLSMFANAPEDILTSQAIEGRELTTREIERALRDAGASRNFAKTVAVGCSESKKANEEKETEHDANQWDAEIAILKSNIELFGGNYDA